MTPDRLSSLATLFRRTATIYVVTHEGEIEVMPHDAYAEGNGEGLAFFDIGQAIAAQARIRGRS